MKKKILTILLICLCLCLFLTSCAKVAYLPDNLDQIATALQKPKAEMLQAFGLTEENAIDTESPYYDIQSSIPIFPINAKQKLGKNELYCYIASEFDKDSIYEVVYTNNFTEDIQGVFDLAARIETEFDKKYAYCDVVEKISLSGEPPIKEFEDSKMYSSGWTYEDKCNIYLRVQVIVDDGYTQNPYEKDVISITIQIQPVVKNHDVPNEKGEYLY